MSQQIVELIEEQGKAFEEFRKKQDVRFSRIEDDLKNVAKRANRPAAPSDTFNPGAPDPEHRKAFASWARKGEEAALRDFDAQERKAMSVDSDPDGGFLAPTFVSEKITAKVFDLSPVRKVARVETVNSGNSFEEIVDKDEAAAEWVGERQSRGDTNTPQLALKEILIHEMHAQPKATQRIIDDARVDIEKWLVDKVGDKFGRAEADAFINGDGVLKPRGFLTYQFTSESDSARAWGKLQYVPTGAAGAFAGSDPGDCLINLTEELRAPYRANATWLMSRTTAKVVRKLKDGDGNYLWERTFTKGQPPMLLGYPVEIAEDMPSIGANSLSIAFGDFKQGYCIVDRTGIRMLRDPFTEKPYVRFYTTKRVGGDVMNFEAIKALKFSAA